MSSKARNTPSLFSGLPPPTGVLQVVPRCYRALPAEPASLGRQSVYTAGSWLLPGHMALGSFGHRATPPGVRPQPQTRPRQAPPTLPALSSSLPTNCLREVWASGHKTTWQNLHTPSEARRQVCAKRRGQGEERGKIREAKRKRKRKDLWIMYPSLTQK